MKEEPQTKTQNSDTSSAELASSHPRTQQNWHPAPYKALKEMPAGNAHPGTQFYGHFHFFVKAASSWLRAELKSR